MKQFLHPDLLKLPEARLENGAVPSAYFGQDGIDATTDRLSMSVLSWHAADVEQKFPAPTTFKYTTLTLRKAAAFYDVVCAHYLANEPWSKTCEGACNSRSHKVAFDHFPGIEGEDLRDEEQKKKRRADQAAGKEKRETAVFDEREKDGLRKADRRRERHECVGRRVRVEGADGATFDGVIMKFGGDGKKVPAHRSGRHYVVYDDGAKRWEKLFGRGAVEWDFLPDGPPTKKGKKAPPQEPRTRGALG